MKLNKLKEKTLIHGDLGIWAVEGMGLSKKQLNLVEEDTMALNKVPDVTGMGAKDAVFALQKRGLRVRINGCGQITKQDIPAGSVAVKGKQITLTASTN